MAISLASVAEKAIDSAAGGVVGSLVNGVLDMFGLGTKGPSIGDQKELMKYQNDLNMDAWMQQFTTTAQYNDPAQVVKRYMGAGINPASAFDKNTVGISSAAQSNPVTGYPAPNRTIQEANPAQYMSSIAQLMSAVSGSRLSDAQANAINEKLFKELRAMDDAHEWQDLNNTLLQAYGDKKASAEVQLALQQLQKAASETKLANEQALTEAKKRLNIEADLALKALEKDLRGFQLKTAKIDLEYYRRFKLAELDNIYADSREKQTRSESNLANARDLSATAEGKELVNNISRATNLTDIDNALYSSEVIELLKQSSQKEELWQELQRLVRGTKAYKEGDSSLAIETTLERLAKICGIKTSVGFSPTK